MTGAISDAMNNKRRLERFEMCQRHDLNGWTQISPHRRALFEFVTQCLFGSFYLHFHNIVYQSLSCFHSFYCSFNFRDSSYHFICQYEQADAREQ